IVRDPLGASKNRADNSCRIPKPGEESWMATVICRAVIAVCSVLSTALAYAQNGGVALTGQVSSAEEGMMEGVVVSARKDGSTISISVVTDAEGRLAFPAPPLAPGR